MNKSLLIVICDFLLLSLLSIANFDKPARSKREISEAEKSVENETFVQTQMLETLKTALEAEQQRHLALSENVERLSKVAEANLKQAQTHKKILGERERQLRQMQSAKAELERERERILKKSAELEQKVASTDKRNAALQGEIITAAAKLEKSAEERVELEKRMGKMRQADASIKRQLQTVQQQLKQNKENLARLQDESNRLKLENRAIEAEKRALATQLEVAATKTQIYEKNLERAQILIDVEKAEKEKIIVHAENLSSNVSTLAQAQKDMSKNIDNLRPQTASETFEKIRPLFAEISFKYSDGGLLGKKNASKKTSALPLKINGHAYLLVEAGATPLAFSGNAEAPEKLDITVQAGGKIYSPDRLLVADGAKRILAISLPDGFIGDALAIPLASEQNTYRFTDCIVVNPNTKYYGQTPFMANFTRKDYAKVDVGLIESIFKTFSPAAGDIALTRSGEALGIMTSSTDLYIPRALNASRAILLGDAYSKAAAQALLRSKK